MAEVGPRSGGFANGVVISDWFGVNGSTRRDCYRSCGVPVLGIREYCFSINLQVKGPWSVGRNYIFYDLYRSIERNPEICNFHAFTGAFCRCFCGCIQLTRAARLTFRTI